MKKVFLGAVLLLLFFSTTYAQQGRMGQQRKERIESYRIAYFTEKLQLTPDESKDFWPLFNQFEEDQKALRAKYNLKGQKIELLSDTEVKDFIMNQLEMESEQTKLKKDYILQMMEVLPIRKVAMLQRVNREFKKELLRELRERRQQNRGGRK